MITANRLARKTALFLAKGLKMMCAARKTALFLAKPNIQTNIMKYPAPCFVNYNIFRRLAVADRDDLPDKRLLITLGLSDPS